MADKNDNGNDKGNGQTQQEMRLVMDDNGLPKVEDGKPVYLTQTGKEAPMDVPKLWKTIDNLKEEKNRFYQETQKLGEKLSNHENKVKEFGVEDLDAFFEEANSAIQKVKDLESQKLLDTEGIDKMKAEFDAAWKNRMDKMKEQYESKISDLDKILQDKERNIYQLMVSTEFAKSPIILNRTNVTPQMAEKYWGEQFKVEERDDGKFVIMPYDQNGEIIPSMENPGEPASFEEALGHMIDADPMKETYLKAPKGGSGGDGSGDSGGGFAWQNIVLKNLNTQEKVKLQEKIGLDNYKRLVNRQAQLQQ